MGSSRIAIVRIDDADYTDAIYVYGESRTYGEVTMIRHVEVNDQSAHDLDLAYDALYEAAMNRRSEDEKFDISRKDAAENERVADAYVAAAERLRAAAGLDEDPEWT